MKSLSEELTSLFTKRISCALTSVGNTVKTIGAESVANSLIGMSEKLAKATCESASLKFRIGSKDGKKRILTMDHRRDRITVDICKGFITKARVG
jgi:hypothetical protein